MRKIILVGAGGHCKSIIDLLNRIEGFEIVGVLDCEPLWGSSIMGVPIIGDDALLPTLVQNGVSCAFITVGSVGDIGLRERLILHVKELGFEMPSLIDPTATVTSSCKVGNGVYIGKHVCVNADAVIEDYVILNTGSIIEHDCKIGKYVHVAPNAVLCGNVKIGRGTHVGANATIIQGVNVGSKVMIGAGAVVIRDVVSETKMVGNPARMVD